MADDGPSKPVQQQPAQQDTPPASASSPPPASPEPPLRLNTEQKSNSEEHKEIKEFKTEIEDRIRIAEKWIIWLTAAIAFFALCQVAVGIFQWYVMSGQLTEMRNGSTDTHTLAESAKRQADKAETISGSIQQAVGALQKSATAAQASVQTIQRQMRLDQRPWLKFELGGQVVNDKNPNDILKSVTFTEGQVPRVPVRFVNVGKTAARGVHGIIIFEIVPLGKDPNLPQRKKKYMFLVAGPIPTKLKAPVRAATPMKGGDIFPGMYSEIPIDRVHISADGRAVEGFPLGHQEALSLLSDKSYFSFYGELFYSDIFGVKHWTRFCYMRTVSGASADSEKCAEFSDVDAN
ncbi:MAG TPA: hypothetical protein VFA71_09860 [Terriglobales bacterium]|nr:hypothetical protein [Terriglobales bacterium]